VLGEKIGVCIRQSPTSDSLRCNLYVSLQSIAALLVGVITPKKKPLNLRFIIIFVKINLHFITEFFTDNAVLRTRIHLFIYLA
jgi:hypothetical protein